MCRNLLFNPWHTSWVPIDPDAAALAERIKRSGGGSFAGRTVQEVRHEGVDLGGTWSLDADSAGIIAQLTRFGPSSASEIARSVELDDQDVESRLESLKRAGFVRCKVIVDGDKQWSGVFAGHRRSSADTSGAFALLEQSAPPTESVETSVAGTKNISLDDGVKLRIYFPDELHASADSEPLLVPVVLYVHGGAWVSGSIDTYDAICHSLVELSGCAVVSVGYRLAPEYPFPAQIDDTINALKWVLDQGEAIGLDVKRIAMMGDSVGGNLATVVSMLAKYEGWCEVALQILLYPVLDLSLSSPSVDEHADAPLFSRSDMEWMYSHYGAPSDDWKASPLHTPDLAVAPPAVIVTAGIDPARDDGARYAELLRAAGVEVEYLTYDDMMHGFFMFSPYLASATDARLRVAAAMRRVLLSGRADDLALP